MGVVKKKIVASPRKKNNSQPKQAVKVKKEKDKNLSNLVPRMRLEPRLISSSPGKIKDNLSTSFADIEKYRKLLVLVDRTEVERYLSSAQTGESNQKRKRTISSSISNFEKRNHRVFQKKESPARNLNLRCRGKWFWSDGQLRDLALGLQSHGFADLDKVAEVVKTKTKNDIDVFLKPRRTLFQRNENDFPEHSRGKTVNKWCTNVPEHLKTWPNIRKWRRIAWEQVIPHVRKADYSEPVIASLCQQFYEEEAEPTDPQVINVKLIYKYLMDSMAGKIPPQLPPKESALVLDMLREMRSLPIMYDFEEEKQFLREFKSATDFKPFQVKDEFKKKIKKDATEDVCPPNTIPVLEEVFLDLSRHRKLLQSFNPLVTPVWMIQKAQEHVKNFSEESNVYVD